MVDHIKSLLSTYREEAKRAGLADPDRRPNPKPCRECGMMLSPVWKETVEIWTYPDCGEVLACQVKKESARHFQAYEKAVQRAKVPIPMRHWSLFPRENREALKVDKKNKRIADICGNWDKESWLVISGSVGSGKTTWLTALLLEYLWENTAARCLWTSEQRMFRRATLHSEKSHAGRERIIQEAIDAEVLLLDDLGAGRRDLTEWQGGAMRDLFMERHLEAKPTLITTNLSIEDITARYGDHVSSRIGERTGGVIQLGGSDRRLRKRRTARP